MIFLKPFIIASSIITTIYFYYIFYKFINKYPNKINVNINNLFFKYSIIAPIGFGIWNIISFYLAKKFNLTLQERFLIISIISYLFTVIIIYIFKIYNFSKKEWIQYFFNQFIRYFIIWNVIIYYITKLI